MLPRKNCILFNAWETPAKEDLPVQLLSSMQTTSDLVLDRNGDGSQETSLDITVTEVYTIAVITRLAKHGCRTRTARKSLCPSPRDKNTTHTRLSSNRNTHHQQQKEESFLLFHTFTWLQDLASIASPSLRPSTPSMARGVSVAIRCVDPWLTRRSRIQQWQTYVVLVVVALIFLLFSFLGR